MSYAPKEYTRARSSYSALQKERLDADCRDYLPTVLGFPVPEDRETVSASPKDAATIREKFPKTVDNPLIEFVPGSLTQAIADRNAVRVAVVLSGGQAPGGHNIIAGIFDGIKRWNPESVMIGFLDGPHGLFTGNYVEITDQIMDGFRNTGGFDMLGSGRHKIESTEQFENSMKVCTALKLDGVVVIGGDDSNTNGAVLAEYFAQNNCNTKVVGAPKTIDGDLKCPPHIPISFGFDTACKTYASLVGNVAVDAMSTQKYYHIVRLMGRSASNIALEVALLTRPNACLIGEEVSRDNKSLKDLTSDLADMIQKRSEHNKNYGVILLPEGLIEFIPEFNRLISEMNDKMAASDGKPTEETVKAVLSEENRQTFEFLPDFIRAQLLLDRDPHGNVQVAKIETEKLLAATVAAELEKRRTEGKYKGSFKTQFHAYGYEGRAGMPSVFDASYCYACGSTAAALLVNGKTGYIASVKNLLKPAKEWICGGVPITSLCVMERRHGENKPVINKALVNLEGPMSQPFQAYAKIRDELRLKDDYRNPGPIQYDMADCPTSTDVPITLQLELNEPLPESPPAKDPQNMNGFLHSPVASAARSGMQQWRSKRQHRVPDSLAQRQLSKVRVSKSSGIASHEQHADLFSKFFEKIAEGTLVELGPCDVRTDALSGKHKIGVVFCGRQAPGCHDFLCGLVDMIKGSGEVLGFVGGTKGLFAKQYVTLTPELCKEYAGTGGMELLGRTADKLNSDDELEKTHVACSDLGLTGLILVGGARTSSDAVFLAETFSRKKVATTVVAAPSGMEGNLVNEFVETTIGFDSASKAVAQLVGNTAIDGSSARKYYYFLRVMDGASDGSKISSSHLALEVALQTKPNMLLLSEEVDAKRMSLRDVVSEIADVVELRAKNGANFGTVLVAEGLLGAIPEFHSLISELEKVPMPSTKETVMPQLSKWSKALFDFLPGFIQDQLLLERQSNAAVQMSQLETERLLATLVETELKERKSQGSFSGSFSPVCQFLGYQARCSVPSDFDMDYGYTLGATSAFLAAEKKSGYMAIVSNLADAPEKWVAGGIPLTTMLQASGSELFEQRPSILPNTVDMEGAAYRQWKEMRVACAKSELYENPGPIQLSGPSASARTSTVMSKFSYLRELDTLSKHLAKVQKRCRPGCDPRSLRVAAQSLSTLNSILNEIDYTPDSN